MTKANTPGQPLDDSTHSNQYNRCPSEMIRGRDGVAPMTAKIKIKPIVNQGRFLFRKKDDTDLPHGLLKDSKVNKDDLSKNLTTSQDFPRLTKPSIDFNTFEPTPNILLNKNKKIE